MVYSTSQELTLDFDILEQRAEDYALSSMLYSSSRPKKTLTHAFLRNDPPRTSMDTSHHLADEDA